MSGKLVGDLTKTLKVDGYSRQVFEDKDEESNCASLSWIEYIFNKNSMKHEIDESKYVVDLAGIYDHFVVLNSLSNRSKLLDYNICATYIHRFLAKYKGTAVVVLEVHNESGDPNSELCSNCLKQELLEEHGFLDISSVVGRYGDVSVLINMNGDTDFQKALIKKIKDADKEAKEMAKYKEQLQNQLNKSEKNGASNLKAGIQFDYGASLEIGKDGLKANYRAKGKTDIDDGGVLKDEVLQDDDLKAALKLTSYFM